jgi:hypothetical protein
VLPWRHEKQQPSQGSVLRLQRDERAGECVMSDAFFLGLSVGFFVVCAAYAHFCGKVR